MGADTTTPCAADVHALLPCTAVHNSTPFLWAVCVFDCVRCVGVTPTYWQGMAVDSDGLMCACGTGFELVHIDEFIDELLKEERVNDIILPRLQSRYQLEMEEQLEPYASFLDELEEEDDDDDDDDEVDDEVRVLIQVLHLRGDTFLAVLLCFGKRHGCRVGGGGGAGED